MLKIDHVAIWTNDIMSTAWQLHKAGLASYDGGYFPHWGVAHRAVPLGNDQYIELEQMVGEETARADQDAGLANFAVSLRDEVARNGPKLLTFIMATDDFDGHRRRLGIEEWPLPTRVRPDGFTMKARGAPRSPETIAKGLPPFVDFLVPMEQHPARIPVVNPVEPQGIAWLEIGGDQRAMQDWLGPEAESVPLRFIEGPSGVRALGVAMADGDVVEIRPGGGKLGITRSGQSASYRKAASTSAYMLAGGMLTDNSTVNVPDTNVLGGHLGFPGVFSSNFDFQLSRLMGAQTYGGAELGECLVTARRIPDRDMEAWTREWSALATRVEALAFRSQEKGHIVSAREAYLRSCCYYRTAQFFLAHKDPLKKELWQRSRDSFQRAGHLLDHPFEPVMIPYADIALPGYFLHHGRDRARPTVLIHGGGDTTAEELYFFCGGAAAIRRGFNALLFEGPGQVGTAHLYPDVPYRHDWETPVGAVVDYVVSRPEVDPDRLAIMGYSFGGYLAPRAAAFEKRLRACVAASLVPDIPAGALQVFGVDASQPIPDGIDDRVDTSNPAFRLILHDWLPRLGGIRPTVAELARTLRDYKLWGLEDKLTCALLAVSTVGEGRLHASMARQFFDAVASKNKKYVFLTEDDGADGHCAKNNTSRLHQEEFDWLEDVLEVRPRK